MQLTDPQTILDVFSNHEILLYLAQFRVTIQYVIHCTAGQCGRLLGNMGNGPGSRDFKVSSFLMQFPAQQSEQARLARTIGSDNADTPAGVDLKGQIFNETARTPCKRQITELDQGRMVWDN